MNMLKRKSFLLTTAIVLTAIAIIVMGSPSAFASGRHMGDPSINPAIKVEFYTYFDIFPNAYSLFFPLITVVMSIVSILIYLVNIFLEGKLKERILALAGVCMISSYITLIFSHQITVPGIIIFCLLTVNFCLLLVGCILQDKLVSTEKADMLTLLKRKSFLLSAIVLTGIAIVLMGNPKAYAVGRNMPNPMIAPTINVLFYSYFDPELFIIGPRFPWITSVMSALSLLIYFAYIFFDSNSKKKIPFLTGTCMLSSLLAFITYQITASAIIIFCLITVSFGLLLVDYILSHRKQKTSQVK